MIVRNSRKIIFRNVKVMYYFFFFFVVFLCVMPQTAIYTFLSCICHLFSFVMGFNGLFLFIFLAKYIKSHSVVCSVLAVILLVLWLSWLYHSIVNTSKFKY